ncbi:hypothetical protein HETIRDRAFT_377042 [Heterobasidion irregulare TC 32-1]|uniref:G-alpha-domain-containing protein n=1 Tax=Heterobasidion irregulare (strain TC 32-1) TaxID=747525 RepID=W4KKQ5_HETIT|nr:uncharacterized protein HETIRDRAFT_377042 [Heterobasidion irregulare TC 32-1]ETW86433.1 hypothetical protein HETIRDRAFT_377042 [Heterobasidion irregulare TC 32-1]
MPSAHTPPSARRRSLSDPIAAALRPPVDETPAERERRLIAEHDAKKISDSIDEQIRLDRAELKKNKPDVKVLLLGQSESGKSTTLKREHSPPPPLSFCSPLFLFFPSPVCPRVVAASGNVQPAHAYYSARLAALVDLEARLMRMLGDEDEDEPTRLDDGSAPGWSLVPPPALAAPRPEISVNTSPRTAPPTPSARSPLAAVAGLGRGGEMSVRPTSNWKKALGLGGSKLKGASPGTGELLGWWEDPADPVHVLSKYSGVMVELWDDQWVKARLRDRRIRLEESSGFYLDEIERITAKKYIPTDDDVLKARLKTVGVVEHAFLLTQGHTRGMNWKIYDVGGARNQRQAWAPYFQDVNAIIFLAPISAFDQVLAEDPRVNRLEDSLLLWRSVVANKLLSHVNIILFLNKCDLLHTKLEAGVQLSHHMFSYGERPNDYDSVSKYLRNKFGALHQQSSPNQDRELFIHFTAVTDTRRTTTIIQNVRDFILKANLKDSKLIS